MSPDPLIFAGEHIYASCVSDDEIAEEEEDGMYAPEPGLPRANTVERLPLPIDIAQWTTAEVQRWLEEQGLGCFKKPFYNNGITGLELLDCR